MNYQNQPNQSKQPAQKRDNQSQVGSGQKSQARPGDTSSKSGSTAKMNEQR